MRIQSYMKKKQPRSSETAGFLFIESFVVCFTNTLCIIAYVAHIRYYDTGTVVPLRMNPHVLCEKNSVFNYVNNEMKIYLISSKMIQNSIPRRHSLTWRYQIIDTYFFNCLNLLFF